MPSEADRRAHPRLPLNMLVQFRLHDMDEFLRHYAVNISAGGMFIRTEHAHPIGSMVYLQFSLEDGAKLIEGLGKVVHVNPADHPSPGMGIEFVSLDAESLALIERIIRDRSEELDDSSS
jgi:uncharacterized protein (TIGR02266 family)